MTVSLTIGVGIAITVAIVLLWAALMMWPRKVENDFFGVGALLEGIFRTGAALLGTVALLLLYIALKAWGF